MADDQNPFLIGAPPGFQPRREPEAPTESETRRVPARRAPETTGPAPVFTPAPTPLGGVPLKAEEPAAPVTADNPQIVIRGWRLSPQGGRHIDVDTAVVLGRRPTAPAERPGARAVPLEDESKTVSKTHALVEPAGDGLRIVDLGSTNGVKLARGGEAERIVPPGLAVELEAGDIVHLGDLRIAVARA
ncbi:FHA domain-containing protein [Homoserinibacter sp. YIM 151385]|uniref:FHA domain-containing protein n=1 Tax=Homoserinibacter sp. YIM 151385 TaxID=2985506 RepID=UPI0022F13417|nr:FHA domain-containing protein [Homoserinibacter sp. YIM 151385]WBU39227.1 FHA domain-containing protein [Homoserinibacter sp. YIM 151385]